MIVLNLALAFIDFVQCVFLWVKFTNSEISFIAYWLLSLGMALLGSLLLWEAIKGMVRYFRGEK